MLWNSVRQPIAMLIALVLPPAALGQQYFDDFEAADLDPFWNVSLYAGPNAVTLSTAEFHSGGQSVALRAYEDVAGGGGVWKPLAEMSKGAASVWVYDAGPATSDRYCFLTLQNATVPYAAGGSVAMVGMVDWDAGSYWVIDPTTAQGENSNVTRSPGWHHFEIIVGSSHVTYRIDGSSVATYDTDFAFDHVYLEVFGPNWRPAATYYFDEFGLNARPVHHASFLPLGFLVEGSTQSRARGISADGSVVVGTSTAPAQAEAFRWEFGRMSGLGDLPGGSFRSEGTAVSGDGMAAAGNSSSANSAGQHGDREAFFWLSGAMTGLGDLDGGVFLSEAGAMSYDGSVIVGRGVSGGNEAFRWEDGMMTGLGELPGGLVDSIALGVSGDGDVVVGYSYSDNGQEAFWWEAGQILGLGDLPGGAFQSLAMAISPEGDAIVGYGTTDSGQEATIWSNLAIAGLGDLPGGTYDSWAFGVSADGRIVVGYGNSAAGREAFIWTEPAGMQSLRDWLIDHGAPEVADWQLVQALGVSADGGAVVGEGINPVGVHEAYLAYLGIPCREDLDGDLEITLADVAILLANFGESGLPDLPGDLNYDNDVDLGDLAVLLSSYGNTCP